MNSNKYERWFEYFIIWDKVIDDIDKLMIHPYTMRNPELYYLLYFLQEESFICRYFDSSNYGEKTYNIAYALGWDCNHHVCGQGPEYIDNISKLHKIANKMYERLNGCGIFIKPIDQFGGGEKDGG